MSRALSAAQIYGYARGAGFEHEAAIRMTAIALAESGGRPDAVGDVSLQTGKWGPSVGLWQVRSLNAEKGTGGTRDQLANTDPAANARAAFEISDGGRNIRPWSVTHTTGGRTPRYLQYMDDARRGAAQRSSNTDDAAAASLHVDDDGGGRAGGPDHVRPVLGATLTDTWGAARPGGRHHEGIDLFAKEGTPIHAVTGGKIVKGFHNDIGGVVVRIEGDDGRYYYYAHLKEGSVSGLKVGQRVETGDVIGQVGKTGDAATTPPHLHLQVREHGKWINPYDFLKPLPEWKAGAASTAVDQASDGDKEAHDHGVDTFAAAVVPVAAQDTDKDGLTDEFEKLLGTDVKQVDTDHDGLSDTYEVSVSHSNPLDADTNDDGETDGMAVALGHNPGTVPLPAAAQQARFGGMATLDTDRDGLSDMDETRLGTDPKVADTDHDGLLDGFEVRLGLNPLSIDSNHDGLTDGFAAEAGLGPGGAGTPGAGTPGAGVPGAGVPGAGVPGATIPGVVLPGGVPGAVVPGATSGALVPTQGLGVGGAGGHGILAAGAPGFTEDPAHSHSHSHGPGQCLCHGQGTNGLDGLDDPS